MNAAAFVDPAALHEAISRPTVVTYDTGRGYVWNTMMGWKEWKATQPKFFDVLLDFVLDGRDPSQV